ncbi:MAG: PrsW family glutamic-type intramembrane protease [Parcubacteria group bacterium]
MPISNPSECKSIIIPVHKPDITEKLFFLLSGMILSVPLTLFVSNISASLLRVNLSSFPGQLIIAAIIAPLLEEFAKAFPLFYRHGETEKSLISLGFYTGLGFGIIEFIFYAFAFGAILPIRFFAVLFHATNTSLVAYGIAKKKPAHFYFLAVLLHFTNNFTALLGNIWLVLGIPAVFLSYILALILYRKAKDEIIKY